MAFQSGTATTYKTLLDELQDLIANDRVDTAAVNAGGTGYVVDDILTVAGGTTVTHTATLRVTSVSGGVIDGIKVEECGAYSADPTLTANAVTGGSGSSATIDLTMQTAQWTVERDLSPSELEQIFKGEGDGGTNDIYVGIRTFQDVGVGAFNWELAGFTGFDSGLDWEDQAGISPGRFDAADTDAEGGAFVLLDNASVDYWFFFTGRYMMGVMKIGSTYESFFLGFIDTYATTSEAAYPLYIAGSCGMKDTKFNSSRGCHTNIIDPRIKDDGAIDALGGTGQFRYVDGNWYNIVNAAENSGAATTALTLRATNVVNPTGNKNTNLQTADEDKAVYLHTNHSGTSNQFTWVNLKSPVNSSPTFQLRPTPDTPDDKVPFFPCVINMSSPTNNFAGEIPGCFWFTKAGTSITAEDEFVEGTDRFLIFSSANQTDDWNYFCVKKT